MLGCHSSIQSLFNCLFIFVSDAKDNGARRKNAKTNIRGGCAHKTHQQIKNGARRRNSSNFSGRCAPKITINKSQMVHNEAGMGGGGGVKRKYPNMITTYIHIYI